MSTIEHLQSATDLKSFAGVLGYKPSALTYLLYKLPDSSRYTEFLIPKRSGDTRLIRAPNAKLKELQRHLARILYACLDELVNSREQKILSHGFMRKKSIYTNAKFHVNRRYVMNIDLENFFPSINFGRVRGFFRSSRDFGLDTKVATMIAQISCYKNELPQGSPSSPVISNLIGNILDQRLAYLAKKNKCTYSRYADDLTFSTNNKQFPTGLASQLANGEWVISQDLKRTIEKKGFTLNIDKFSMQYRDSRQITTGLVVKKKVNIRREYYHSVRAMCNNLFKTGAFYINRENRQDDGSDELKAGTINQLEGMLSFIYKIREFYLEKKEKRRYKPVGISKIYKEFMFYKYFYANTQPLIVTEGKTDISYLKYALKNLSTEFPSLIEIENSKANFRVSYFRLSEHSKDVFAIASGTSGLAALLDVYEDVLNRFDGPGLNHPVIFLIDNDSGSKLIKARIKSRQKIEKVDVTRFYNWHKNLFIVFSTKKANTEIEDLFSLEIRQTELNGKKLSLNDDNDTSTHYGKNRFVEHVIKPRKNDPIFNGFKPIFQEICDIRNAYRND